MMGLLPFHMGAFVAAAETGVPMVLVTILPEATNWAAAVKLRATILAHLG